MTAKSELSELLSDAPVVERLSEEECARLVEQVRAVRKSRLRAMFAAIDEALGHLPRLVRVPAKKILLG